MDEQLPSTPTIWCFATNVTIMMSSKAKITKYNKTVLDNYKV